MTYWLFKRMLIEENLNWKQNNENESCSIGKRKVLKVSVRSTARTMILGYLSKDS